MATTDITLPARDSIGWKACAFIKANDLEELTALDVQSKFGGNLGTIEDELEAAVKAKLLSSRTDKHRECFYFAGPKLKRFPDEGSVATEAVKPSPAMQPAPAAAPAAPPAPVAPTKDATADLAKAPAPKAEQTKRRKYTLPDVSEVQVFTVRPLPQPAAPQGTWDGLFGLLTAPGMSLDIDGELTDRAVAAAVRLKRLGRGCFSVRKIDANTTGIWRLNDDGTTPVQVTAAAA